MVMNITRKRRPRSAAGKPAVKAAKPRTARLKVIDNSLMQILGQDASKSSTAVARQLGVSSATVRRRIKKMIREDTIRVVALANPYRVGLPVAAVISVEVEPDKVDTAGQRLARLPEVKWVSKMSGQFRLMALIRCSSIDQLSAFMGENLTKEYGILDGESQICFDVLKGKYVPV